MSASTVQRVAVIGAGVMGSGMAQTLAVAGLDVVSVDLDETVLAAARERIVEGRYGLKRAHSRGHLDQPVETVMERLRFMSDLTAGVAGCQLVLEAVPEDIGLKIRLFRQLDQAADPGAILASNTSGFPIAAMAHATDRPEQVLGWHWASPPALMRFAEIVVHEGTSAHALAAVTDLASRCGKHPVTVKDHPRAWGFVANRVYGAMVAEARRVVGEGLVSAAEVDQLMVECFNWPIGPLGMSGAARQGWT